MTMFILGFMLRANEAFAQASQTGQVQQCPPLELCNPLGTDSILEILNRIIGWFAALSIPLAALLILVGGYQIMFAGASPDSVNKGRKTIAYTVIGFAVIWLSRGLVTVIKGLLGV